MRNKQKWRDEIQDRESLEEVAKAEEIAKADPCPACDQLKNAIKYLLEYSDLCQRGGDPGGGPHLNFFQSAPHIFL